MVRKSVRSLLLALSVLFLIGEGHVSAFSPSSQPIVLWDPPPLPISPTPPPRPNPDPEPKCEEKRETVTETRVVYKDLKIDFTPSSDVYNSNLEASDFEATERNVTEERTDTIIKRTGDGCTKEMKE